MTHKGWYAFKQITKPYQRRWNSYTQYRYFYLLYFIFFVTILDTFFIKKCIDWVGWLVGWFLIITTQVGYLMPNHVHI